jgi:hemoglobin-like flavoprotein
MPLTDQHKLLVKTTFRKIVPISEKTVRSFYDRLFELDPPARALFKGDFREQGRKFIQMLAVIVGGLDRMEEIVPAVQSLAKRHMRYGVTIEQYATVGQALLWSIENALGAEFTPDVKEAWQSLYEVLSSTAIQTTQS